MASISKTLLSHAELSGQQPLEAIGGIDEEQSLCLL